jgi:hypothetical protein
MLAGGFGAMFREPGMRFVHAKLVLAIVAAVLNLVVVRRRARLAAAVATGGPELDRGLGRLAMLHGLATMMLPLAIVTVFLWR